MKHSLLSIVLALALGTTGAVAQTYQEKKDTVWGRNCYVDYEGHPVTASTSKSSLAWPTQVNTEMCYCLRMPNGHIKADAVMNIRSSARPVINVRIVDPTSGDTIYTGSVEVPLKASSAERTVEILPDVVLPKDTWYYFVISSPTSNGIQTLKLLEFSHEENKKVQVSDIFIPPSVHLHDWSSSHPDAPSGPSYDWCYLEVMVPVEEEMIDTYIMALGVLNGYMGIQSVKGPSGSMWKDFNHNILFSMWDAGDMDKNKELPEYLQSRALDAGPGVTLNHFTGEGTGSQAFLQNGSFWTPGHWIQFITNVRPENVYLTVKDRNGEDSTFEYQNVLVSAWYKMDNDPGWKYICTHRVSGQKNYFAGWYSFLEPFSNQGGNYEHRAYFRNGYMRSLASGQWYNRNRVTYGHTQGNGSRNSRTDYGHGAYPKYGNCFFLSTGGYMDTHDTVNYVPLPLDNACVDTINLEALKARVDQAVMKAEADKMENRLNAATGNYDMSQWTLMAFSDANTTNEGDSGPAAKALDGNENSYWHSKYTGGIFNYPHWLNLDAGETVEVNSLAFYSARGNNYHAKKVSVYTCDDGKSWTLAAGPFEVANAHRNVVYFDKTLSSRYYRVVFNEGYGKHLMVNELYLRNANKAEAAKILAADMIEKANTFENYAKSDLQEVIRLYADGEPADGEALFEAVNKVAQECTPLRYGKVQEVANIGTARLYQLCNAYGRGVVVGQEQDGVKSLSLGESKSTSAVEAARGKVDVTLPVNNWQILRSERFGNYYVYNPGLNAYLDMSESTMLSDQPKETVIAAYSTGFTIKQDKYYLTAAPSSETDMVTRSTSVGQASTFFLYDNIYMEPSEAEATQRLREIDAYNEMMQSVSDIDEWLRLPAGVVGSVVDEADKQTLKTLAARTDLTTDNIEEVNAIIAGIKTVEFTPLTTLYRIRSANSSSSNRPYLTYGADGTLSIRSVTNRADQVWTFEPQAAEHGYLMGLQGRYLELLPAISSNAKISTVAKDEAEVAYLTDRGVFKYSIGAYWTAPYGIATGSSAPSAGKTTEASGQWYLEPVNQISVSLNAAGMTGLCMPFGMQVPETAATVYTVDNVTADGVIHLQKVETDTIPAYMPVILVGKASAKVTVSIFRTDRVHEDAPLLHGTAANLSKMEAGSFYTLTYTENQCRMSTSSSTNVAANSVYLLKSDGLPECDYFTFSLGEEGIRQISQDTPSQTSEAYDLQGRRVGDGAKGIVVTKGRKARR